MLANLAVGPSARRRGVAQRLVDRCEVTAMKWGFDEVTGSGYGMMSSQQFLFLVSAHIDCMIKIHAEIEVSYPTSIRLDPSSISHPPFLPFH